RVADELFYIEERAAEVDGETFLLRFERTRHANGMMRRALPAGALARISERLGVRARAYAWVPQAATAAAGPRPRRHGLLDNTARADDRSGLRADAGCLHPHDPAQPQSAMTRRRTDVARVARDGRPRAVAAAG